MPRYDLDEVEQAFRRYWKTTVDEDWDAWADMFTEDADYLDCYLGSLKGREAIREYIKPLMASCPEVYSTYEWHLCSPDGRCVVHMQNRRDNPEPGAPPIDCAGITVLQYSGDGKFSNEEDYWDVKAGIATTEQYVAACTAHDPDYPKKRTRRDWGPGPDWTQGAPSYAESPRGNRSH
ncbi:MAG: nuclear transport factor 2 family protein [Acidimicrobiia bacterium]